ncbi:MAG: hypothetical protein ACE5HB_08190 [Terriglobia bacterium]
MVFSPWQWLRIQVKSVALSRPRLMTVLVFFFLYTVSNSVHYTTTTVLPISPFWQMLAMGAVLATFTSLLIYEIVQQHRRSLEAQSATKVARTIRDDINKAFTAIRLSTEKLRELRSYDEISVRNILAQATYIRDALNKLAELDRDAPSVA